MNNDAKSKAEAALDARDIDGARAAFESVLAADPGDADALHFFAVLAFQAGALTEARDKFITAIAARPGWAKARRNLGSVELALGHNEAALEHLLSAIAADADDANAYYNLALAHSAAGDTQKAVEAAKTAVRLGANGPDALTNLAVMLKEAGRLGEAEFAAHKAIGHWPDHAPAYVILAAILHRSQNAEAALTAADKAISLNEGLAEAHVNRGNALQALGRTEEAAKSYRTAIKCDAGLDAAYYYLSSAYTFQAGDGLIADMERALTMKNLGEDARLHIHFALAKAYEDIGDAAAAAGHLRDGNGLKRQRVNYDVDDYSRKIDHIIQTYSAEALNSMAPANENAAPVPIFVLGMPRSGTTLAEQILASHPNVFGGGETPHFQRAVRAAPEDYAAIGETYLAVLGQGADRTTFVTDKVPHNFEYIGVIALALARAKIIHVSRDALDTCLSCYANLFTGGLPFTYEQRELGRHYRDYARLMDHWRTVLGGRIYELSYEGLIADQEGATRHLLDFCGVSWDAACLAPHQTERGVFTASAAQVRQPVNTSSIGRAETFRPFLGDLIDELEA